MTKTPKEKMIERLAEVMVNEISKQAEEYSLSKVGGKLKSFDVNRFNPYKIAEAIINLLSDQIEWVEGEGDDLYILGIMIMELRELINKQLSLHGEHCGIDARMQGVEGVFKTLKANKLAYNINGGE